MSLYIADGWPRLIGSIAVVAALAASAVAPPAALADGGKHNWNYDEMGADWGKLYPHCNGRSQTPISLEEKDVGIKGAESLFGLLRYKPTSVEVFNNNGRTVQVNGEFGTLSLPDGVYDAKQFHFHFPAEHEELGKLPAGEMHIVHQKRGSEGTKDLAVVGVLLDQVDDVVYDEEAALFGQLGFGTGLPEERSPKDISALDLNAFKEQFKQGFWHYQGSLTTPPCSETVHWYVLKRHAQVTQRMVEEFKATFPTNSRRLMPLNGRTVTDSDIALPDEYQDAPGPGEPSSGGERKKRAEFLRFLRHPWLRNEPFLPE